jgi:hypothetical protein
MENKWKQKALLGNLIADKSEYEAMFHSRVAEKLLAATLLLFPPHRSQYFSHALSNARVGFVQRLAAS